MAFSVETITGPTAEPLSLDEAKAHLRIDADQTAEDDDIGAAIVEARDLAERHTGRRLVTQTMKLALDRFPPFDDRDYAAWPEFWPASWRQWRDNVIRLYPGPVAAVVSLKYYATTGVLTTLTENTDFLTRLAHQPPLIYPYPGKFWPVTQYARRGAVEVEFTAGYGAAKDVPAIVKRAMKLAVAYWYEHRGDGLDPTTVGSRPLTETGLPAGAIRLLNMMTSVGYC